MISYLFSWRTVTYDRAIITCLARPPSPSPLRYLVAEKQSHDMSSYRGISSGTLHVCTLIPHWIIRHERDLSHKGLEPFPEHRR